MVRRARTGYNMMKKWDYMSYRREKNNDPKAKAKYTMEWTEKEGKKKMGPISDEHHQKKKTPARRTQKNWATRMKSPLDDRELSLTASKKPVGPSSSLTLPTDPKINLSHGKTADRR